MRQYHVALERGEIGRYVFLPGNPGRVERMAKYLDKPYFVRQNREYCTWNGYLDGELLSIVSTGIGGPSAAIAMEELGAIGADTFIRTGTCGLLQDGMQRGDLVIATGSVRGGATADAYVPLSYPAVAHHEIVHDLIEAAKSNNYRHHTGIIQCKDAFFLEDPDRLPRKEQAQTEWDTWMRAGVVASEMESDTLFVIASIRGYRMGTVLLGLGGKAEDGPLKGTADDELERMTRCSLDAMRRCIARDKIKV
jgi:uridine phosphorylase